MIDFIKDINKLKIIYKKQELYISNFISILDINSDEVILRSNKGLIKVYGSNIVLSMLLDNEILLKGNIMRIDLDE